MRRKSATAEAAERQYRATAEVAQRRRRYAPAAAALGWAGRDAAAALKMHQPQKITLYRHLSAEMLQMFLLVSRGETRYLCAPASGGKSRFCGAGGAQYRARGGELEDGEKAEPPSDRANRGKSERSSGGGAGGGGEHSPPARAMLLTLRRGGQAPPAPQKPKVFHRFCRFFAAVPYFFRQ